MAALIFIRCALVVAGVSADRFAKGKMPPTLLSPKLFRLPRALAVAIKLRALCFSSVFEASRAAPPVPAVDSGWNFFACTTA
jgi:hypothetical protein